MFPSYRDPQGKSVEYGRQQGHLLYGRQIPFLSTIGIFVIPSDPWAADDGDPSTPFLTVQAAVDAAQALPALSPGQYRPIYIAPGIYLETVYARGQIALLGLGGREATRIQAPAAGLPAVVCSDATLASLQAWIATGLAAWYGAFGSLVAGGTLASLYVNGVRLAGWAATPGLVCAGVGIEPVAIIENGAVNAVDYSQGLWSREATVKLINTGSVFDSDAAVTVWGGSLFADRAKMGAVILGDDAEADMTSVAIGGDFTMTETAEFGGGLAVGGSRMVSIRGDLELEDTTQFRLEGGFVAGTILVSSAATMDLLDVHVQGATTLENAAPLAPCTADGGRFVGVVTDAGVRLTRTLGT